MHSEFPEVLSAFKLSAIAPFIVTSSTNATLARRNRDCRAPLTLSLQQTRKTEPVNIDCSSEETRSIDHITFMEESEEEYLFL
jgi:hypothetical protein